MRQRLEDAEERYAEGIPYNQDRHRNCSRDFVAGAEWLAKGLWHGTDETLDIDTYGVGERVVFKVIGFDTVLDGLVWLDLSTIGGAKGPIFTGNGEDYDMDQVEAWCYVRDLYELFKLTRCGTQDRRNI